ncbi:MAG: DUF2505 domain-containing protein [Myxococcota bacterium]
MKFEIEHTFSGISLAAYERLYFDEPFNSALCEKVELDRELLKLEENGDALHREVKVSPRGREIPKPIAKFMGVSRIEYVEKIDYTFGSGRGTWLSVSSFMTDKIDSGGTIEMLDTGAGVKRIVAGEIKVKVFGLGKTIESFIVEDVKRSYQDAAAFTRDWIAAGNVVT